jgi:DNA-binding transcriptional MocR family regulator
MTVALARIEWEPGDLPAGRPAYVGLADVLAGDIARGRLQPGDRLPTHRGLARHLGVTVGTVARAYAEAERRGLIAGEVGRGTFVRAGFGLASQQPGLADLASLHPPITTRVDPADLLAATLTALAGDPITLRSVVDTDHSQDAPAHRDAAAAWVAHGAFRPAPDRVLLTSGAQHALTVALLGLVVPNSAVVTTPWTNPGLLAVARQLSVPLVAVASDREGMLPDALAAACRVQSVSLVHLQPTLDNPTGQSMSAGRRAALAQVCAAAGVWVLEDDPLGPLAPDRPDPIAALLPERTCHVASAAKVLSLGLRLGVLSAPEAAYPQLAAAVRASTWLAAPLLGEVLARWVTDGTADRITAARREAVAARDAIVREVLPDHDLRGDPTAPHRWLALPEPWSVGQLVAAARDAGVLVSPGDEYVTGRQHPAYGIRIGLNADLTDEALRSALLTLVHLLAAGPAPGPLT